MEVAEAFEWSLVNLILFPVLLCFVHGSLLPIKAEAVGRPHG